MPIGPAIDGVEQQVAASAPSGWRPDKAMFAEMKAALDRFLALRDKGDKAAAYAMLTPAMKARMAAEYWMAGVDLRGPLKQRAFREYSWYVDPPEASAKGVYLAADFIGSYESAPVYCGYVMVHRARDGKIGISRMEENVILKDEAKRAGDDGLKRMIAQMPC